MECLAPASSPACETPHIGMTISCLPYASPPGTSSSNRARRNSRGQEEQNTRRAPDLDQIETQGGPSDSLADLSAEARRAKADVHATRRRKRNPPPKNHLPDDGTALARLGPPSRMRRGSRQVDVHIIAQSMRAERSSPFVARAEEARAPPRSHARAVPATVPRCPRFETRLSDNRSLRRVAMVLRAPH
jgi:hypothetical protein